MMTDDEIVEVMAESMVDAAIDGRAVTPWRDIPEDMKEAFRQMARSIFPALRSHGMEVVPVARAINEAPRNGEWILGVWMEDGVPCSEMVRWKYGGWKSDAFDGCEYEEYNPTHFITDDALRAMISATNPPPVPGSKG